MTLPPPGRRRLLPACAWLLGALTSAAPGCVVTSEPTYQPAGDCPPYYVLNAGLTPSQLSHVDLVDGLAQLEVSLVLSSCATDKTFAIKPFIDREGRNTTINVPPNDGSETRNVHFTLDFDSVGCHEVELPASANPLSVNVSSTDRLGADVAYVRFYVDVRSAGGASHTLADCVTQ